MSELNQGKTTNPPAREAAKTNLNNGSKTSTVTSGMNVGAQVIPINVKTGEGVKTIEGGFPGDHRAPSTGAGITDAFKTQNGPRGETTETELEGA
jgi:hypothetical protein